MLPLSTLLSHTLVAFTIEFDNEAEHRIPHRTTDHGFPGARPPGPWLASLVMYSNCMRFIGDEGVTVRELARLARTGTNLDGMRRWGYIVLDPPCLPPKRPKPGTLIRVTRAGRKAQEIWRPLFDAVEERWEARFGIQRIDDLRSILQALIGRFDIELPDCLPILGYGLFSKAPEPETTAQAAVTRRLPELLSKALLAFAIEFERESELSLAICANVVRVLDEKGVKVRDLPACSGVSKEAIAMAMGVLRKQDFVSVETRMARLTTRGLEAQRVYRQLLGTIEERWQKRFGSDLIQKLLGALEALTDRLYLGLEPYPDGWRASVPRPVTLPHYPMVLHRGGFPDGS